MESEIDRPVSPPAVARTWLALAVFVLLFAGVLALALVVGRAPPFDRIVGDPGFFRRCLVVHVDLSIVVWFHAFALGLVALVPSRRTGCPAARVAPWVATIGVVLFASAAGANGAKPLMANYVPFVDHPLFGAGLLVFAGGVTLGSLHALVSARAPGSRSSLLPPSAQVGALATAGALVLAAITFAISWARRPVGVEPEVFYELLVWGGGHVLQVASTAAMLTCWLFLVSLATGREPLSRWATIGIFVALLAPWTFAPILAALGTQTTEYRNGFTRLMQLAIAPAVVAALGLLGAELRRARREGTLELRDPRFLGFAASAVLTLVGFFVGSLIRGSNTIVPGHYHASIGAVTAAFMTTTYVLLERFGMPVPGGRWKKLASIQPVVFAGGQLVFAAGFAVAGAHGTMRKTYGAEQHARSLVETVGLAVMGTGGLFAILGGVAFLAIAIAAWRASRPERARKTFILGWWRQRWQSP